MNRVVNDLQYYGLNAKFIKKHLIKKALGKGVIFPSEKKRIEAKKIVKFYEERAASDPKSVMGYKNTQALISFYFNTPNNTLSTFWEFNDKPWVSFFPRRIDKVEHDLLSKWSIDLEDIKMERKRVKNLMGKIERERQAERNRRNK